MRHTYIAAAVLAAAMTSLGVASRPYFGRSAPIPAEVRGAARSEPSGSRAPDAVLLLLDLGGPATVTANSRTRFTLTARYSDGTAEDVTDRAEWSVDSPYASISRGALAVGWIPADQGFTVTAWFTDGLALKAARPVTVSNRGNAPDAFAPGIAEQAGNPGGRGT